MYWEFGDLITAGTVTQCYRDMGAPGTSPTTLCEIQGLPVLWSCPNQLLGEKTATEIVNNVDNGYSC